jgi:hypothetical protein
VRDVAGAEWIVAGSGLVWSPLGRSASRHLASVVDAVKASQRSDDRTSSIEEGVQPRRPCVVLEDRRDD